MKISRFVCVLCSAFAMATAADTGAPTAEGFLRVIRANDLTALRAMSPSDTAKAQDRQEWTPLPYAALYGSVDAVQILLKAGADPAACNKSQATPLMYGAYDLEKTNRMIGSH